MVPEDLSFQFIRDITDDFSEEHKVGAGAFGVVYKGVTKDGLDVAVKKLKPGLADLGNKQFRNEFGTLRKLDHLNIVKFLGYCYETEKIPFNMPDGSKVFVDEIHTALCFEYLHNGSLQKHLSDESCEVKLDWHMRFKVIKGICEGLKYMHKDLEEPIYHFDLKPDNILLDKDMVPKIADFGLSRMFGQDIARTTHNPYGTLGYQPPEYIDRHEISGKFDIFSLGAVMKRMVSRPMGYPDCPDNMSPDEFIDQVRENWRKKLKETCSSSDSQLEAYCRQVETCTQIALHCLNEDSQKRPDIVKITEKLNEIEVGVGKTSEAYSGKATIFTMHDLVHDLAISILGNKLLDKTKQEDSLGRSMHYQYALLGDCSCSMPLSMTEATQLIALRFLDCRSTELCTAAFAPAKSLRVLDLSECFIHELPGCIAELKELRYLSAPGLRDWMFPECITKLSHLIYLNLHGSSTISPLPESIGEMKDLMHLDLSGCTRICRLPDSFMNLEKLVHLDFSDNSLMLGKSESFGSLSRLEHLSLSKCRINGDLAKVLDGLKELQYLDLSEAFCWGHLSRGLQKVLVRFTKLRYLDVRGVLDNSSEVDGVQITNTFIKSISSLSSLEYLNIGWNHCLRNIPECIGNLSKLRTLDLSHCINLERLPAAISGIENMKFVYVAGCYSLDKSTIPLYKNVALLLPYFVVHTGDTESSSNLYQLEYGNPTKLEMSRLENVKSAGEAQRIKLVEKERIEELGLVWTRDAKRFVVEDKDVLEQLVPPCTVTQIRLQGYNSAGFPSWMMDICTYVPHLVDVTLEDMPNCSSLPPLGQLPNLRYLCIGRMDNIKKIGLDLYVDGGFKKRAFPQLRSFKLQEMKCLKEWNTPYSYPSAEDGLKEEVALPDLHDLMIEDCPMLRFESWSPLMEKPPPLAPMGRKMTIIHSGQVIPLSWECRAEFDASSSSTTTCVRVQGCKAPLHEWSLLRHLPYLRELHIENCSDLTCSSTDLLRCLPSLKALYVEDCQSIIALPERLGDLTSLEKLEVSNCEGVKVLPESIKQLTRLQCLDIYNCPLLVRWCRPEQNQMRLAPIKRISGRELIARLQAAPSSFFVSPSSSNRSNK